MSSDEYSEDVPDDLYMQDASSVAEYFNAESQLGCHSPITANAEQQQMQPNTQRQVEGQRQKRKYVRRKDPGERKKRGPRAKDLNAPKMPLNGYVRFLNANRERVKNENSDLTFAEVTKKLAAQWSAMESELKKVYLDEAEKAKEVYLKELHEYQQTDQYQKFMSMKRAKQIEKQPAASTESRVFKQSITSGQLSRHSQQPQQPQQQQQQQQSMPMYQRGSSANQQYCNDSNYTGVYNTNQQSYSGYNNMPSAKQQQYGSCMSSTSDPSPSNSHQSYQQQMPQYYHQNNSLVPQSSGYSGMYNNNANQRSNYVPTVGSIQGYDVYTGLGSMVDPNEYGNGATNYDLVSQSSNSAKLDEDGKTSTFSKMLAKCNSVMDLPIFSEEFLEHNRLRDLDLKREREDNQQMEEQTAILSKYVEELCVSVDKLQQAEIVEKNVQDKLKNLLNTLQSKLVDSLQDVTFPTEYCDTNIPSPNRTGPPTMQTIDQFMGELERYRQSFPKGDDQFSQKVGMAFSTLNELNF